MVRIRVRLSGVLTWIVIAFLFAPIIVLVLSSFTPHEYLSVPTTRYSLRWYSRLLREREVTDSLLVSMRLGILSGVVAVVSGTLGAIGVSRLPSIPAGVISFLSISPLMVPPLVLGVALLQMFAGMKLNGMFVTLVLGHSILTLPYVIRTVSASVKLTDRNMERAALDLGASWGRMIFYVTLPSVQGFWQDSFLRFSSRLTT